jgi:hypothetical protein
MHFEPAGSLWVIVGDAALPPYVRLRMDLSDGSRIASPTGGASVASN